QEGAKVRLEISARRTSKGIEIIGRLTNSPRKLAPSKLPILIEGVGAGRHFLSGTGQIVSATPGQFFRGRLKPDKNVSPEAVCLFAGTRTLASASSGYVPIR